MANTTQIELSSVVSLWRYPVKSMMGEELNAAEVTDRGLLGDRAYALAGVYKIAAACWELASRSSTARPPHPFEDKAVDGPG